MKFVRWFFARRSKDDWKSWNALFATVPFALLLILVSLDAHHDSVIGQRQQSAIGIVTAYEPSNHNQCTYKFEIRGTTYSGESSSPTEAYIGQTVRVYFDSANPATNSLQDFESASQGQRGMQLFLILGIVAIVGFIVYSKSRSAAASVRQTSS